MSVRVGRQLRIDEDIHGLDDEALDGLIWMARKRLHGFLDPREYLRVRSLLDRFERERQRRRKLAAE